MLAGLHQSAPDPGLPKLTLHRVGDCGHPLLLMGAGADPPHYFGFPRTFPREAFVYLPRELMEPFLPRQETKVLDGGRSDSASPRAHEHVAHGGSVVCVCIGVCRGGSPLLSGDIRSGSRLQSFVLCPGRLLSVDARELMSVEEPHHPELSVSRAWGSCPSEAGR